MFLPGKLCNRISQFCAKCNAVEYEQGQVISDKDWKTIRSTELKELAEDYKALKESERALKERLDEVATAIKEHKSINHARCNVYGLKVMEKTRIGNVDYKKLLAEKLPDVDVSGYRKPTTIYKEIKL